MCSWPVTPPPWEVEVEVEVASSPSSSSALGKGASGALLSWGSGLEAASPRAGPGPSGVPEEAEAA